MTTRTVKALAAVLALVAGACGGDGGEAPASRPDDRTGSLTVYSGRGEELVGPLFEQFEAETGIDVEVRYGDTAQMAGAILEEGDNSPADVYFGQDAGALGALAAEGRLLELPAEIVDQVPEALRSAEGRWVGLSGRARVVVYNTGDLTEADLPDSILDFTDPEWSGRIGWAPTNGSFQAFVTALRVLEGEDAAREWLEGIVANDPQEYNNNIAVLEAVAAGEVEVGFANHYYLYRFLAEDPDYPVANKFFGNGDPGGLINVAGVGIVDSSDRPDQAQRLIEWLLSDTAQAYFAEETFEIPVVPGTPTAAELPDLEALTLPDLDLDRLEDLEGTLALLNEVGAL
jgi:iron(III) transport system substrate-binding protein